MKNRHRTRFRRCAHCSRLFIVEPRLGGRHRFCADPACKDACHQLARKKWLKENGGKSYFRGAHTVERVREWRRCHPGYWKRRRSSTHRWPIDFVLSRELALVVKEVALQESIDTNFTLKITALSRFSKVALQESIAKKPRLLMMRGHVILCGKKLDGSSGRMLLSPSGCR